MPPQIAFHFVAKLTAIFVFLLSVVGMECAFCFSIPFLRPENALAPSLFSFPRSCCLYPVMHSHEGISLWSIVPFRGTCFPHCVACTLA